MPIQYKQKCMRCKKNYVLATRRSGRVVCWECQKPGLDRLIEDPEMKKLFDLPEEYYKKSMFLRNIKLGYLSYGRLTEKQIEAFKKAVDKLKTELALQ